MWGMVCRLRRRFGRGVGGWGGVSRSFRHAKVLFLPASGTRCGLATFADSLGYVARLPLGVSDLVFVLGEYEYADFTRRTNTHIIDVFGLEGLENLEEIGRSQEFLRCRS